jgi:hypothetical protein
MREISNENMNMMKELVSNEDMRDFSNEDIIEYLK